MQSRLTGGMPAKLTQGPRTGYDLSRMGAGAARGANRKKKLVAAPWSGTWPAPGATLDLDFANNRGFVRGMGQGGVMDGITYTRASAGWYVDQNGLLVEAANNVPRFDWASTEQMANKNLVTASEAFNDANYWGLSNCTVSANTANTTDPNGGNTADYILETTANGNHFPFQTIPIRATGGANVTVSVYVKPGGRNFVGFYVNDTSFSLTNGVIFDISAGTVTKTASGVTTAITSAGDGWYRISATCAIPAGYSSNPRMIEPVLSTDGTTVSYVGDTTKGVYMWGAQVEYSDSVTIYQPIAQPTTTTTPLFPAPTCNGLLIEEARTNRLLWCRDATDAAWVKTDITAAKDQTGIDGVANAASSLTATAANGTCIQTITLASGSRTGSVYLKRLTGTGTVQVSLDGSTWSTVELSDTEWRRIVLSGTVTNPVVGIKLATNGDAVAMDYAQVEDGADATSPILTTTASATRSADNATMAGENFYSWYNCYTGSFLCKSLKVKFDRAVRALFAYEPPPNLSGQNYLYISSGGQYITMANLANNTVYYFNQWNKTSLGYKVNDVAWLDNNNQGNGQSNTKQTGGGNPLVYGILRIGSGASGAVFNGYISRLVYCPKYMNKNSYPVLENAL